jgi:hypothetical protein
MRSFLRCLVALLMTAQWGLLVGVTHAQDLSGAWVWNIEGRNLMVFELVSDGEGRLAGTLKRPTSLMTSIGGNALTVSGVEGPIVTRRVETVERRDGAIHIAAFDPDDPSGPKRREYVLGVAAGGAELRSPIDNRLPAIPLIRPRPPLEVAADLDPQATYVARPPAPPSNVELAALFEADQAPRTNQDATVDWSVIGEQDRARRARTRELLDSGQINSADDYWRAAFIFQHGDRPEDYLLAHSLAVAAIGLGRQDATWIAAATMDRYLHSIGKPQIYGTQFQLRDAETTQGDFNRELLPDQVRRSSNVPTLAEQARSLDEMNADCVPGTD